MRVGLGFDAHRFGGPGPIVLGGVVIEHNQGIVGHSDGDVLSHALADAVLGAAALGDLGEIFGADRPELAGADSLGLLAECVRLARAQGGLRPVHADATVVCAAPRLGPHRAAMADHLAAVLGCRASVKATTTDGMGFTGRGEGIAALAAVLLE